jgi:glycosyltransferase involved in cell wall biosynthesis
MQALGLWEIGWRDFAVFSSAPDPDLPFEQSRIVTRGPLQLVPEFGHGCQVVHAHQNAGLFLKGKLWPDLHGFTPVESRLHWRARHTARALAHAAFSRWATGRLLRRADRILCASRSIADEVRRWETRAPVDVLANTLCPDDYPPAAPAPDAPVLVIGGFTARWGRTMLPIVLETARLCPELRFRLVGEIDETQRRQAAEPGNVVIDGRLESDAYRQALRESAIAFLPFADWCRGGGARQKLIQAAATGLAIVATSSTLEGFEGRELVNVGQTPDALAGHLRQLAGSPEERGRRGAALRAFALREHDWLAQARRLAELYDRATAS